jgi:hypothetical protein
LKQATGLHPELKLRMRGVIPPPYSTLGAMFISAQGQIQTYSAFIGEKRNVYRLLVGKPEGKRPLGRPRSTWIDDIKMDLLEIGLSVVD